MVALRKAEINIEALELLREILPKTPNNPELLFEAGMVYLANEKNVAARMSLEKALKLGLKGDNADRARKIIGNL